MGAKKGGGAASIGAVIHRARFAEVRMVGHEEICHHGGRSAATPLSAADPVYLGVCKCARRSIGPPPKFAPTIAGAT